MIAAAVKDLGSRSPSPTGYRSPWRLAFAPAALLTGASLGVVGISLAVGLAVLVLAAGMFALGWIGGGDAKLMAAASLWLGLKGLAPFVLYTGLAGGALALILLALRSAWPAADSALVASAWARRLATPGESAPYGVAIAVGALAAFGLHPGA